MVARWNFLSKCLSSFTLSGSPGRVFILLDSGQHINIWYTLSYMLSSYNWIQTVPFFFSILLCQPKVDNVGPSLTFPPDSSANQILEALLTFLSLVCWLIFHLSSSLTCHLSWFCFECWAILRTFLFHIISSQAAFFVMTSILLWWERGHSFSVHLLSLS